MTVQTRDVIFRFEDSCNSWCCLWSRCCKKELDDSDPVYVTPKGELRHFDYKARGGSEANARRTLSNIHSILQSRAADHNKLQAIGIQVYNQMQLVLDPPDSKIISLAQARRIEQIALPIIQSDIPGPPMTPKHSGPLVRSPATWDLSVPPEPKDQEFEMVHSEAVIDDK